MKIRATLIVRGRVQGVAFRHHTARTAQQHGVTGWVRNLPDGSVEACLEGEEADVLAMVQWCRRGPELARVDELNEKLGEYTGEFTGFQVRG
ncbi:acylphosphatase [Geomonas sp. Red69]|uniref:Acylphosphatase n=1 Tax=Geomonas diazotrophica TaxID=2843197 RepID=A0ABX8JKI5_9BACT|nr:MULTISPECIES: acylphosphatase [Geomonas]MBU5638700.1 acylphosphatase [Geomonas diazotrophica]QWV98263.1 acylphosphatase [Geomonas nitrogeniifigens]QXE87447.1 acylphosphatase [Geomonas nitrogeniifigens]